MFIELTSSMRSGSPVARWRGVVGRTAMRMWSSRGVQVNSVGYDILRLLVRLEIVVVL